MKMTNLFRQSTWIASCLFGTLMANAAVAQDGACCPPPNNVDCNQCSKLYSDAAARLKVDLSRLDAEGCAAKCCEQPCTDGGCCDNTCGCNDGCGWCNLGEAHTLNSIFKDDCTGEDHWLNVGGWTQWGYTSDSTGLFNTNPHGINNHQSYLYMEKVADGSNGLDWGFRADLVYGTDAADTQAFGASNSWDNKANWNHGIYGFAMPQLYAELASGDWSVKMGHFYTLVGYEVVTAPDNFFYSHAFTMYNSEPFTHSGFVATYKLSDNVEVYGGWTAGWDTGFDRFNGGSNFLGGISASVSDNVTVTYITTIGDFGARGEGYMHSLVLDVQVSDKINYVVQSDLLETNAVVGAANHTIGINQYLFYTFNDCLKAGSRLEWWKSNGESIYNATFGLNYRPHANLVIRPEIRHQWGSENTINGLPTDDTITGIDAILTF